MISQPKTKIQIGFKGMTDKCDEGLMPSEYAVKAYNYSFRGGALSADIGIDRAEGFTALGSSSKRVYPAFPSGVKIVDVFTYRRRSGGLYDDRLVVQTDENKLYYTKVFETDTWHEIAGLSFSGKATAVNYNYGGNDVLLLSSENNGLNVLNGTTLTAVAAAPKFSSVAVHYERVYGTVNGDLNQVWFSDDFDPENWTVSPTTAGYITFADECGDVLKAVSFSGYLYVFREHGLFRLTAFGDQSEFSLKKVFIDTGRIYKDTIALCGDRIIFLAEEGLFSFDGYEISRIGDGLPKLSDKENSVAAYHAGRYYLACKTDLGTFSSDSMTNNILAEYDLKERTVCVLAPCDIVSLYSCDIHHSSDLMIALRGTDGNKLCSVGTTGKILGKATSKLYVSPYNTFGSDRYKTVGSVTVCTSYAVTVTVKADGESVCFTLAGSSEPQTFYAGISGRKLGFELTSSAAGAYITPITAELYLT